MSTNQKEIKVPSFTLGWEFESVTDIYGNRENDEDNGYSCDSCGDQYNEDCDDHNGVESDNDSISHDDPCVEVSAITDGSVNGAGMEYVLRKEFVHAPDMGIHALWKLLKQTQVETDKSCGFHVHIGLPERSTRHLMWAGWMQQLGRMIEDDVFLAVPESRRNNQYCMKLKNKNTPLSKQQYVATKYSNHDRYYWINVVEMFRPQGIRTVEFRLMGNVHRFSYLLAWIAFCRRMAVSAYKLTFDVTLLDGELEKLRSLVTKLTDTFYPRVCEQEDYYGNPLNRLELAYRLVAGTGLELRPALTARPLWHVESAYDDIQRELAYQAELAAENSRPTRFHTGDIVRKIDGHSNMGRVFILDGAYISSDGEDMVTVHDETDSTDYYAWRFELVDINGLIAETIIETNIYPLQEVA